MKIAYWAPYVSHVGTVKAVVRSAAAVAQFGGHDVRLIRNHREWEESEADIKRSGVRIDSIPGGARMVDRRRVGFVSSRTYMLAAAAQGLVQLPRYLRRHKIDVLITNLVAVPALEGAKRWAPSTRVVVSVQGFPKFLRPCRAEGYPFWMAVEDAVREYLWSKVYTKADLIICMTEQTAEMVRCRLAVPRERVVVVPNPVIDTDIHRLAEEGSAIPWLHRQSYKSIAAVGRLTKQKDFETLLRAIDIVRRTLPVRLAILGEGEERSRLEGMIEDLGLEGVVKLPGYVGNPFAVVSKSDLFVCSSLWEDPGHALIEAAALGVPIVSTRCPNGPEEILAGGKAGALCPPGEPEALAAAIARCLTVTPDESTLRLAREAAARFTPHYHYDSLIRRLKQATGL